MVDDMTLFAYFDVIMLKHTNSLTLIKLLLHKKASARTHFVQID